MKGTVKIDYTTASGAQTSKQVTFTSSLKVEDIVFPTLRALIGVWGTGSNDTKRLGVNEILSKIGGVKGIFGGVLVGDSKLSLTVPETVYGFAGEGTGNEANRGRLVSQTLEGNILTEVFSFSSLQGTLFGNTPKSDRLTVRLAHRLCTKALSKTGLGSPFINYLQGDTLTGDTPRATTARFSSEYGVDNADLPYTFVDRYYDEDGKPKSSYGGSLHYKGVQVESPQGVGKYSLGVYSNVYKDTWKLTQEIIEYKYNETVNKFLFGFSSSLPSQIAGLSLTPEGLAGYTIEPSADDIGVIIGEFANGTHDIFYSTPNTKANRLEVASEDVYNSIKSLLQGTYMFMGTNDNLYLLVLSSTNTKLYRVTADTAPSLHREYNNRVQNGSITGGMYFQIGNQQGFLISTTTNILYIPLGQTTEVIDLHYRDSNNKGLFFYKVSDTQPRDDLSTSLSLLKSCYPAGKYTYNTLTNPLGGTVCNFSSLGADWSKGLTITVSIDFS